MLFVEALVRFSAITMLLLLALAAVSQLRWSRSWPFLCAASVSTAALFVSLSSAPLSPPYPIALIAGFLNIPHLVLIWLFALCVFQTDFKLRPWHLLIGLLYCAPIGWFRASQFGLTQPPPVLLNIGVSIGSIALVAHVVWTVLRERPNDLLEPRRNSRLTFVCTLVAVTVATGLVDVYLIVERPAWSGLIKAAILWPAVPAAFIWLYGAPLKALPGHSPNARKTSPDKAPSTEPLCAKDAELMSRLADMMELENVYLDPSMTVSKLARTLGVTSHRLRALINTALGHENFNQFLNRYRIDAITARLDDRSNDHIPILTLALEGGFSSISPFNRAFRHNVGETPSAYRARKRMDTSASS